MKKELQITYKQDCTEIDKDKILPQIKQDLLTKMIRETNADIFNGLFDVQPYTDEDAWRYVDMHGGDNCTYFNYGVQYEPQELFKLAKSKCFTVTLYFTYWEENDQ